MTALRQNLSHLKSIAYEKPRFRREQRLKDVKNEGCTDDVDENTGPTDNMSVHFRLL